MQILILLEISWLNYYEDKNIHLGAHLSTYLGRQVLQLDSLGR